MSASPELAAVAAIEIRGVRKHFGTLCAVDGIDLQIHAGEILGLIGRNGAGKSTLFKLMLGLERPTEGDIHVAGVSVQSPQFRETRRHLGYLPENIALYDNLSGLETLRFFARLKGAPLHQCDTRLAEAGLADAAHRPVREYSKGMRQKVAIALALLRKTPVLLLDEPTSGLDPIAVEEFNQLLKSLCERGVAILMVTHDLFGACEVSSRIGILRDGRLVDQFEASVDSSGQRQHVDVDTVKRAFAGKEAA